MGADPGPTDRTDVHEGRGAGMSDSDNAERELELAEEHLDAADAALLAEVAALLEQVDPVPADLVERVQFALALDEVFAEVAQLTRLTMDALAVRSEPGVGTRTESLTFSADRLTAMVTVTRAGTDRVRMDGWLAPEGPMHVSLRMQDGTRETTADDAGRFVFEDLPDGFAQLSFRPVDAEDAESVVVTPLFQL